MRWLAIVAAFVVGVAPGAQAAVTVNGITLSYTPAGNTTSGSGPLPNGSTFYYTAKLPYGTTIGTIAVHTTGGAFSGSLSVAGTNGECFQISNTSLQTTGLCGPGPYDFTIVATQAGTTGSQFTQAISAYGGATYYLSPTGDDANSGTSFRSAWLTPDHPLHCGDFIIAEPSWQYSGFRFQGSWGGGGTNEWGTVTCPGRDNVAWVKCAKFDACKFSQFGPEGAMELASDFWGVQGFQCNASPMATCFQADPPTQAASIGYLVYADDICNNAGSTAALSCFNTAEFGGGSGPTAVDEMIWIGDLAYNGDPGNGECGSNFADVSAANLDAIPGTHKYWALNISWHSHGGVGCAGTGKTTDDNGMIFDSPNVNSYTGQIVVENNLVAGNGGTGIHMFVNGCCQPAPSSVDSMIVRYNTAVNDFRNPGFIALPWGINFDSQPNGYNADYLNGLMERNIDLETVTSDPAIGDCNGVAGIGCVFSLGVASVTPGSIIDDNWFVNTKTTSNGYVVDWNSGYSCLSGPNVPSPGMGVANIRSCNGNVLGRASPGFANPKTPGAPHCAGTADTLACMAPAIAGFKPNSSGRTVGGATVNSSAYGAVNSSGDLGQAPCDGYDMTPFILNVERALPADMNRCG